MITDEQIRELDANEPDRSTHGHIAYGWTSLSDICRDALDPDPRHGWRRGDARAICSFLIKCTNKGQGT